METEKDNKLAFLDTAVLREPDGRLTISVYRKPTHTDQYLAYNSHHPQLSAFTSAPNVSQQNPPSSSRRKNICYLFWFLIVILFLSYRNLPRPETEEQWRTRQRVQKYCGFTLCQRSLRTASPLPTTTGRTRYFQVGDYAKISVSTTRRRCRPG